MANDNSGCIAWIVAAAAVVSAIVAVATYFALHPSSGPQPPGSQTGNAGESVSTPGNNGPSYIPLYTTNIGLTGHGLDFDQNPPQPGGAETVVFISGGQVGTWATDELIVLYRGSPANPSGKECHDWAVTHPTGNVLNVVAGDKICIVTSRQTVVLFTVTRVSNDAPAEADGLAQAWTISQ
jgi:hypothetical protein